MIAWYALAKGVTEDISITPLQSSSSVNEGDCSVAETSEILLNLWLVRTKLS